MMMNAVAARDYLVDVLGGLRASQIEEEADEEGGEVEDEEGNEDDEGEEDDEDDEGDEDDQSNTQPAQ